MEESAVERGGDNPHATACAREPAIRPRPIHTECNKRRPVRDVNYFCRSLRSIPRELWPVVRRKLKMLDVAAQLEDLTVPPGNRLERLKGKLADRFGVRVNDRYRVTFLWTHGHVYELRVEDYH